MPRIISPQISPFLPQMRKLFKKHKIKNAYIFGSVLTEKFKEDSDVDFLVNIQEDLDPVDAGEHLWDLTYQPEELLRRKIDLLTERSLKNPYFIKEVNETRLEIYGK